MTNHVQPFLIDSHCHLQSIDLAQFNENMDNVIAIAREQGVKHLLSVCVEPDDLQSLYQLADRYSNVSISVGVHPSVELAFEPDAQLLQVWADHPACIAIGETGLDYYRCDDPMVHQQQQIRFRQHIRASIASNKPLIIHTRDAADDTFEILKEENASRIGGVIHCFTESWDVAKRALDLNFYISLSGIVTFKKALQVQEVARKLPLDRLLIETDAPYLAPVPLRGKQNHPALVKHVALAIAELRKIDYSVLAEYSSNNFYRCFNIQA
ncbi:MAG: TatD family hydrolase [Legionella sp.]